MSYGLRIPANDKGAVIDTSNGVEAFSLAAILTVGGGASGSVAFPEYVGFNLHVTELGVGLSGSTCHSATVSYPNGTPTVSYTTGGSAATKIMVFAT